jgi:hypothetical protein
VAEINTATLQDGKVKWQNNAEKRMPQKQCRKENAVEKQCRRESSKKKAVKK